jgi:uncharacterized BrkB/YihY/UPF0761 family membrane protein
MSNEQQPAEPSRRDMTVGQIVLLIVGIILLLPGACSLFFMISLIAEKPSNPFSDPYVEIFYGLWIVSFIVSAIGVALIYAARKKARTTGPDIR